MKSLHILVVLLLTASTSLAAFAAKPVAVKRGPISDPLYIINGIESDDNMDLLDPRDIERLTILKDSASVARYNDRGFNGIILVDLKQVRDMLITPRNEAPYVITPTMPRFRADTTRTVNEWIQSQIRYPRKAARHNIDGNVSVVFIVEKDGRVRFCKVTDSPDRLLSVEAVRILRSMPPWTPGMEEGEAVRVKRFITIPFRIPGKYYKPIMRIH